MKKVLKKFGSAVLALSIAASMGTWNVFAAEEYTKNAVYDTDFSTDVNSSVIVKSGGTIAYQETTEEGYDRVFAPEKAWICFKYADAMPSAEDILVSFDLKLNSSVTVPNGKYYLQLWQRYNKTAGGTTDYAINIEDDGVVSVPATKTWNKRLEKDVWHNLAIHIDKGDATEVITYYINGEQYARHEIDKATDGISSLFRMFIGPCEASPAAIHMDNLRVIDSTNQAALAASVQSFKKGDSYIRVVFDEPVLASSLTLADVDIKKTETKASVKSATAKLQGRTLFIPVSGVDYDEEYAIILPGGITSVLGKSLADSTIYYSTLTDGMGPRIDGTPTKSYNFEDTVSKEGETVASTSFTKFASESKAGYFDIVDSGEVKYGKVLQVKNGDESGAINVREDVGCTSEQKRVVQSFDMKVKQNGLANGDTEYVVQIRTRSCAGGSGYSSTYDDLNVILHKNALVYAGKYSNSKRIADDTWMNIKLVFDYETDDVTFYADDTFVGTVEDVLTNSDHYYQTYIYAKATADQITYIDNFAVGTYYEADSISSVSFINGTDEYRLLDTIPTAANKITLASAGELATDTVSNETVKVLKGEQEVAANVALDGSNIVISGLALDAASEYSIAVDGVTTSTGKAVAYQTTFNTEAEKGLEAKNLLISYYGDAADMEIIKNAMDGEVYVGGELVNASNSQKSAWVITATYKGDEVEAVSLKTVTVAANETVDLADEEICVNIPKTSESGYKVKAFVWMADGTQKPLCVADTVTE